MFQKTNVKENQCQIKSKNINQINTLKGLKFTKKQTKTGNTSTVNFPIST